MKHFTLELTNEGATLIAYLLDASPEMQNASVRPAILICPGGGYRICSNNPVCKRLLQEMLPILQDSPQLEDAMGVPFRMVVEFGGGLLTEDQLNELDEALRAVPVGSNE